MPEVNSSGFSATEGKEFGRITQALIKFRCVEQHRGILYFTDTNHGEKKKGKKNGVVKTPFFI